MSRLNDRGADAQYIGRNKRKRDSDAIVKGEPIYTGDMVSDDALTIRLLRSPHAHADIESIDLSRALKVDGIVAIYTWEDVPDIPFTLAGQSWPEPSGYDHRILSRTVRYVGDPVAIIAGTDWRACQAAMKRIKVKYRVKEAVLDYKKAADHPVRVHEEEIFYNLPKEAFHEAPERNIAAELWRSFGEPTDEVFKECDIVHEGEYETQAQAHAMMETYRSFARLDQWNRLVIVSSTQVPFHIKRQLAVALGIPAQSIRIIKPRVGGGFGGKQTSVTEIFPAFVTWKTGLPSYIQYSRTETMTASNTRHQACIKVKIGATKDGHIQAIAMDALSNTGAYGDHAGTTLNLMGEKSLPMYNKVRGASFHGRAVYTNIVPGGAFRGYGATQGIFALECAVNELAELLDMDPCELRLKNSVVEGDTTLAYGKIIRSCTLDRCIDRVRHMAGWDARPRTWTDAEGNLHGLGMAIAMQGSGVAHVDESNVRMLLNKEGDFTLLMSPTDTGTGSDTILTQMAAEMMGCRMREIKTIIADTDITPFDPGSYASSGTYVTGGAVIRAAAKLRDLVYDMAREAMGIQEELIMLDGVFSNFDGSRTLTRKALYDWASEQDLILEAEGHYGSDGSPSPYMAGIAEVVINPKTGKVFPKNFYAAIDCGTVINENLARVQAEGGITQGIGLALYEDVKHDKKGNLFTKDFMSYKLPTRKEIGDLHIEFEESYEPTGPFGAKSIGEIVVNTSAPAILDAVHRATGAHYRKLPLVPETVLLSMLDRDHPAVREINAVLLGTYPSADDDGSSAE